MDAENSDRKLVDMPDIVSSMPKAGAQLGAASRVLLFGRTSNVLRQFARYMVVGGVAFAIDFGSLYMFTEFAGLHYLISAAVAFLLGLTTNYILSRIWVFDQRTMENSALEFAIFAAIGIVGAGLNEGIIWLVAEKVHLHYLIAKAISAAVVLMWNFGVRRYLLFSGRPLPNFLKRLMPQPGTPQLASAAVPEASPILPQTDLHR